MSEWKRKRFWKEAAVVEAGGGYAVELDGRQLKTPAKSALTVPTRDFAEMIAAEWDAQQDEIDPRVMPATRMANAAIDKVRIQHAEVADLLSAYGETDLLCYRADAPQELADRQAKAWDPVLDWADETLGVRLVTGTGVMFVPQPPEALASLSDRVHALSDFQIAAFHDLVSLSGSLVLGFAATHHWRSAEEIWQLSRLDENWQIEQWGDDEEAAGTAEIKRQAFLFARLAFSFC